MDANDEKPDFQNMPAIIDVLEVSSNVSLPTFKWGTTVK